MNNWGEKSDDLEGFPKGRTREYTMRENSKEIDYTPEKWMALRTIEKKMNELKKKLLETLTSNESEIFLDHITKSNIKLLDYGNQR